MTAFSNDCSPQPMLLGLLSWCSFELPPHVLSHLFLCCTPTPPLQGIFQGVDRLLNPKLSGQGIADVKRPKTMPAGRRLLQQAQQGT
jgi:hypothetical protein